MSFPREVATSTSINSKKATSKEIRSLIGVGFDVCASSPPNIFCIMELLARNMVMITLRMSRILFQTG